MEGGGWHRDELSKDMGMEERERKGGSEDLL